MQSVTTIASLRDLRRQWRQQHRVVGFVPTMGNLHNGHLQLVRSAKAQCDNVVVSIFVNPMQFGKNEDLDSYPRTLDADKEKLESLGVDALFLPSVEEMYPRGLQQQSAVDVPGISDTLCGASRPGHFRGVATIVTKLFNMVEPDFVFFGEKDYQQLQVIKLMVQDLSMPVDVRGVPTERELSGLAMSSRNGYLTDEQRATAPKMYAVLTALKKVIEEGDHDYSSLTKTFSQRLSDAGFKPDYLHIKDGDTLLDVNDESTRLVILVAAYLGNTRLIDNLHFPLAR